MLKASLPLLRRALPLAAAAGAFAIPLLASSPAHAWWRGGWGWGWGWRGGVVVGVAPPAVVVPPPVVYPAPPVAYAPPPRPAVWVPGHWNGPYWVPGHWA